MSTTPEREKMTPPPASETHDEIYVAVMTKAGRAKVIAALEAAGWKIVAHGDGRYFDFWALPPAPVSPTASQPNPATK